MAHMGIYQEVIGLSRGICRDISFKDPNMRALGPKYHSDFSGTLKEHFRGKTRPPLRNRAN